MSRTLFEVATQALRDGSLMKELSCAPSLFPTDLVNNRIRTASGIEFISVTRQGGSLKCSEIAGAMRNARVSNRLWLAMR